MDPHYPAVHGKEFDVGLLPRAQPFWKLLTYLWMSLVFVSFSNHPIFLVPDHLAQIRKYYISVFKIYLFI